MEQLQNFFNLNKENLINIIKKERIVNGYGALFISHKREEDGISKQIDVYYLKMIQIPNQIREDLIQIYKDGDSSTDIFLYVLFDKETSIILEHKLE